jgi:hypothetical protein
MKILACLLACAIPLSALAATQHNARDYYKELLKAHGFNPLATFVCFPTDQLQTFFLMGRSSEFLASLKAAHKPIDSKTRAAFEKLVGTREVLYWQGFNTGVGVDESFFQRGDTPREWILKFGHIGKDDASGWTKIQVTWPTLRYRLSIHINGHLGSVDYDGKCQPIPTDN